MTAADAAAVPAATAVHADVAVVGAGPAGLTVAAELARRGRSVCLLEAAGCTAPAWEPLDSTDSVGLAYPVEASRGGSLGGSSARWDIVTDVPGDHVRLAELDPADLRPRPWVPRSGWPLSSADLRPHYDRARELFGLSPVDPLAGGSNGSVGSPDPSALSAPDLRVRRFEFGSRDRLLGALLDPLLRSPGVTVLQGATVTAMDADASTGRVRALRARRGAGDRGFEVLARHYVLAGGGIETPRLLLASRDTFPDGVGNSAGLVGRCFMEHPHYTSGLWQPFDGSLLTDRRVWDIRGRTFPVQDKYRLSDEVVEREGLPQVVFRLQPGVVTARLAAARDQRPSRRSRRAARELVDALVAHRRPAEPAAVVATLLAEAPRLGAWGLHLAADELLRRGGRQAPTVFRMRAMAEQVPDPDSRILLGSDRDALGMPRARLDWRLNRADLEGLHRAQLRMKAAMERAGLGRVHPLTDGVSLPPALGGGFHHMGTARMADDPRQGVVDRNCRVHDLDNLYVAGSAVFPTGGYVNPTLTIVALASRLGRHLAAM